MTLAAPATATSDAATGALAVWPAPEAVAPQEVDEVQGREAQEKVLEHQQARERRPAQQHPALEFFIINIRTRVQYRRHGDIGGDAGDLMG